MERIKIGVIGKGHDHAKLIFDRLKALDDIFELVGYSVPDNSFGRVYDGVPEYDTSALLNIDGLQAVAIETEEKLLTKYARMAADKGLHIHMDKPGGESHEEFCDLLRVLKEKNLVFSTGYMYRYNPSVIKLMKMIEEGKLGEIYSVETHMDCLHPDEKRSWLSQFKGGMLFYLGCHLIDLIYRIQGEPEEIIPLSCSTKINGVDAEDYGMAVFRYKNGISFAKTCAAEPGGYSRRQLVVCGSKGTVEIKPFEMPSISGSELQYTDMRTVMYEDEQKDGWSAVGKSERSEQLRYDGMLKAFASYIRGEAENPFSYEYEEKLHELVLRACGYNPRKA